MAIYTEYPSKHLTYTYIQVEEKQQTLTTTVPLVYIPIHKQFERKQVPTNNRKLSQIRRMFELNPDEPLFIEISNAEVVDAYKDKILDVVVSDMVSITLYTVYLILATLYFTYNNESECDKLHFSVILFISMH